MESMNKRIETLENIFHPSSLAIIGGTGDKSKLGYELVNGFKEIGYSGKFYIINPNNNKDVLGLPVFKSITDIPDKVELAIIITPPSTLPGLLKECIAKSVKGIIMFSTPPDDMMPELEEITRQVKDSGARIVGPNSMGLYCPDGGLTIFPGLPDKVGPVSFISHSGAMAFVFIKAMAEKNIWCSKAVTCGNELDLNWVDYLEYFGNDDDTEMIAGYMEGAIDGKKFLETASAITSRKPVFCIKGGDSPAGNIFVSSHTGSMAGKHAIWKSAMEQANIIKTKDVHDTVDHIVMFKFLMNKPVGRRIGFVTGTGGPTVTTVDLCDQHNLIVPELSDETQKKLMEFIPPFGSSSRNPVDLSIAAGVDRSLYIKAIKVLDKSDDVDVIICLHTGDRQGVEIAEDIIREQRNCHKPIISMMIGTTETNHHAIRILLEAGIPAFPGQENTIRPLEALIKWKERVRHNTI
ncbi:MAG: hypothetical protein HN379_00080 [Desulfobacteraceae bacterium]|nr:hypothetical protein [Desulfobacteraceae bacterium]MBT4363341.1 hypothetical protein [Desulfobacteraceae bacterium]